MAPTQRMPAPEQSAPTGGPTEAAVFDPMFPHDPYPLLHRLRAEDPVYWSDLLGGWIVTKHELVSTVMRDVTHFSSRRGDRLLDMQLPKDTPPGLRMMLSQIVGAANMFSDPPSHTAQRAQANKGFAPRGIAAFMPRIQKIVDELIDRVEGRGALDGYADFTQPFALMTIADVMGVSREDVPLFADWTAKTTQLLVGSALSVEETQTTLMALVQMADYFAKALAARVREPREDMMSFLVAGLPPEAPVQPLAALCGELMGGANIPVKDALGNAILACLRHPGELDKVRADPSLWPNAAQELLRFDGPVLFWTRIVAKDTTLGGMPLKAGDMLFLSLAAANRDPEVFPDPDRLDFSRDNLARHLAFSTGPHVCVGSGLVRHELPIVFETLFRRLPKLRLSGPVTYRQGTLGTHGPVSIPLEF